MRYPAVERRQELRVMAHLMADSDCLDEDVRAWMVEKLNLLASYLDNAEIEVFLNRKIVI